MTENPGIHVLSDGRWAELEPLINEVRPPCKVPHDNLRQTIEAIVWRHQNGAIELAPVFLKILPADRK